MDCCAVLSFGLNKISVLVGERGVNNTLKVRGAGECEYQGYAKGEFIDPNSLAFSIDSAVKLAQSSSGMNIDKLYVGIPDSFACNVNKEVGITLPERRRINSSDIDLLHSKGNAHLDGYGVINANPIYYILDDERTVLEPLGEIADKLSGFLSYILVSESFYLPLASIFASMGIEYSFVLSILAKAHYYLNKGNLEPCAVIIDVGFNSTSVVIAKGRGLLSFYHFSLGAMTISNKLTEEFGIPASIADSLKKRAMLSLVHTDEDVYELNCLESVIRCSAKNVNSVISERLRVIAYNINKCLMRFEYEYPPHLKYYLLGDELFGVRGSVDVLAKHLNHSVIALPQKQLPFRQQNLELFPLLNFALCQNEGEIKKPRSNALSFFKNFFKQ